MFERFTDAARHVVVLAQEEARLAAHDYLGTGHLLLGLIREEDGIAARWLRSAGVEVAEARRRVGEVAATVERLDLPAGPGLGDRLLFTPRAKEVLRLSLRESLQLGHAHVDTEHLLLGLISEGAGVGAQVLAGFDVSLGEARLKVILMMRQSGVDSVIPVVARGPGGGPALAAARTAISRLDYQVAALTAEVERLRGLLEENGINPG